GQARISRGIAVADRPFERVAERRRARVIEMDEDVVEWSTPLSARLFEHVPIEGARRRKSGEGGPKYVERPIHSTQDRSKTRERGAEDQEVVGRMAGFAPTSDTAFYHGPGIRPLRVNERGPQNRDNDSADLRDPTGTDCVSVPAADASPVPPLGAD